MSTEKMEKQAKRNFLDLEEVRMKVFDGCLSKAHIYNSVKRGDIPVVRIGNRMLVPTTWIDQIIKAGCRL